MLPGCVLGMTTESRCQVPFIILIMYAGSFRKAKRSVCMMFDWSIAKIISGSITISETSASFAKIFMLIQQKLQLEGIL